MGGVSLTRHGRRAVEWYRNEAILEALRTRPVATLSIKNVPEPLVARLKDQAALHRRSLNHEVIACLEAVAQATPLDPESLLARVWAVRRRPSRFPLTDRSLTRLKTVGRL